MLKRLQQSSLLSTKTRTNAKAYSSTQPSAPKKEHSTMPALTSTTHNACSLRKTEIFFDHPRSNGFLTALDGFSSRDHLLYHGSEDTNGFTFLRLEPTNDTDKTANGSLDKTAKETAVTTCICQLIPGSSQAAPELFSNASIGGQRNDGFEAYATFRNLTPESFMTNSNAVEITVPNQWQPQPQQQLPIIRHHRVRRRIFSRTHHAKNVPPNQPPSTSLTKAKE
jgi:hypothetical protein